MPTTVRLPADDLGATTMRFNDIRGHRYAEIILIGGDPAGPLTGGIYNTLGLNDPAGTGDTCPQQAWDRIDAETVAKEYHVLAMYKNGPRIWCLDWAELRAGAERDFAGLTARWVMWVDVPPGFGKQEVFPYAPITGQRDTEFGINAGSPAFILDDPDGDTWVMKSISLITHPEQSYEGMANLGDRLQPAPGWRWRTVVLDRDLVLIPDNSHARIVQDDLGNMYDRAGGAFSNYKP